MGRIVLRHLTGSRAGVTEEYCLDAAGELLLGRAPSASVRFDPTDDALVGRQHARIARRSDDPDRYSLIDLDSRNGTFLNRQRVLGTAVMVPGDTIQLGAGGPTLRFELTADRDASALIGGDRPIIEGY